MPYIDIIDRIGLSRGAPAKTPGELNYRIAEQIDHWLAVKGLSYTSLNNVIGVLECLKLEVYRRIAAPYEDKKLAENGEVFISAFQPGGKPWES